METPNATLVIDDDPEMGWVLAAALADADCEATVAKSGGEALAVVAEKAFPLAFLDARLPDMSGMELAEQLRRGHPAMRIIMISGYFFADDAEVADAIKESRIDGFLAKPFNLDAISAILENAPAGREIRLREGGDALCAGAARRTRG